MEESKKDIESIGEFGLIDLLTKDIELRHDISIKGIGDDAAVSDYGNNKTLVTTDILTEGVHFDLMYTPMQHLGYKAVVINLSDLYAMNATPRQILVSLALSSKFTTEMIEELYVGIKMACDYYNVDLIGGDTTSSLTGMTISITAIGLASEDKITYRSGAKENDLLCVSGDLGAAFIGLQLLEREKKVFVETGGSQPALDGFEYPLERQLKPEARFDIISRLHEAEILPTSMIDVSDGLSSDILHICSESAVGCKVFLDKVPVAEETREAAAELDLEPVTVALSGGEDYELLFTVPLSDFDKVKEMEGVSIIGHVADKSEGSYFIGPDGSVIEITSIGWRENKDIK